MKIKLIKVRHLVRKRTPHIIMRMFIFLLCTTVFSLTTENTFSQEQIIIDADKESSVDEVFNIIQDQTEYRFLYPQDLFKNAPKVKLKKGVILLTKLLNLSFSGSNVNFELSENNTIVIQENEKIPSLNQTLSKQQLEVKGTVSDANGQPLPGASIAIEGNSNGTTTDIDGNFIIEVLDSNAILIISYIGYKTIKIPLNGKTTLSIILEEDASGLDVVVLTGIRASQQRAISIKKNSIEFVDAITSESAGKLPDANVAEAMQRIPGVTISRTRGQGDFISIRGLGPEFARGSLNGRSIVSASTSRNTILNGGTTSGTGRATNFDVLPSDIIETIEVYKTSSAELIEGGIGGSVNIKTVRPLDFGNKFGFNAKGTSFEGRDLSPSVSGYGSFTNKSETFGAFLTGSYSNRLIREDNVRAFIWSNALDGSGNGEYFPFASSPEVIQEDRERLTLSSSIQWKPNKKTNMIIDLTYSRRNLDYNGRQAEVRGVPVGIGEPEYSLDQTSLVTVGNNSLSAFSGVFPVFTFTDNQQATDDIFSVGLNLEQDLGNGWVGDFDLSYSSTSTDFLFQRADLTPPGDQGTAFDMIIENGIIQAVPTDGTNFSDPNRLQTRSFAIVNNIIDDNEFAARFDVDKKLKESGFFSKFKTGLRYRSRNRSNNESSFLDGRPLSDNGPVSLNVGASGVTIENGVSDFLDGEYSPGFYESLIFISDLDEWRGLHEAQGGSFEVVNDPNNTFDVKENTFAFYGQFDIDDKIGDFPITGNIGFRAINTSVTVKGETQQLELISLDPGNPNSVTATRYVGDVTPFTNKGSYFNVLPSANLKLQTSSNTYLRAAYSKTITRPQFVNLGGYSFNTTNNQVTSAGNPDLNPYKSTNYDIGMEWYTGGTGAIGISFFYKKLSSFVTNVTLENFTDLGNTWDQYSTFENQGKGSIAGTEISIQQPLTFLPDFLDGLGVIANFTFADGEQVLNDGSPIPFPGVSDFSFNSALYYDKGGKFQGRLAYTFRDDFLILPVDVLGQEQYNDSYGQLDASLSYKLTNSLTLFGEAINLTDERNILYTSNPTDTAFNLERPVAYQATGIRFGFGIRGSF